MTLQTKIQTSVFQFGGHGHVCVRVGRKTTILKWWERRFQNGENDTQRKQPKQQLKSIFEKRQKTQTIKYLQKTSSW